jgi:hypothetical protein
MSWLSSAVKSVRKVGSKVGGVVKKVAPLAGLIPGVGTIAGAGIGALGSIMEGHNGVGGTLKAAAGGGLGGLANQTLLKGAGYKGLGALLKGGAAGNVASTVGGGLKSALGSALGNGGAGFGLKDLLGLGIAGAGAYSGIKQSQAAEARAKPMLDASSAGLIARLKQGPRSTQSFSRFRDLKNPFAGQYS